MLKGRTIESSRCGRDQGSIGFKLLVVFKPSPWIHNGNEVDDWMGLNKRNSWFKSQVQDSNRSQDIANLNKFKKFKTKKTMDGIAL
ncbi:hypothetical protein TNCV_2927891 [Trichonephila clavipes]|nr:hypothetical protein TNCV_2927891 [Trichonephila clavipes]